MQQQTHSLCQEPFWIRSSANMFNNRSPLLSSVFEVWLSFRFSSKTCHCFVVFLCGLASFQKKSCRSQLFFLFFLSGVLFLQNIFFWYYPNETLSPFPWRQSQNCQVSSLSKNLVVGVFSNCQRHVFKEHVVSFKGEPFIFGEFSQFVNPFLSKHTASLRRRMPTQRLLNK